MANPQEAVAKLYPYRFVILALVSFINACLQFSILVVPGMQALISPAIGATPYTIAATMPYLTGFVFGVAAGAIADKTSIKLVINVGVVVAFIGVTLRIFLWQNVALFVLASFLLGFGMAALNATSAKIMRLWFPSKSTSIAMGIYVCAATVGAALGYLFMLTKPTTVDLGFQICAVAVAVAFVAWFILGRKHPDGEGVQANAPKPEGFGKHLAVVAKSKNAWVISFTMFFLYGCTVSIQTNAMAGYTTLTGTPEMASILSFFNTIIMGVGGILMPLILSRMSKLKPMFILAGVLNAAVLISILHLGFGPHTFIIIAIEGMLYGVLIPLGKTLPALVPDIRLSHIGAAGGLQSMFQNLGAFLIPSLVISPICGMLAGGDTGLQVIYIFTAAGISSIICGLTVLLIPETGTSVAARMKREAEAAAAASAEPVAATQE